MATPTVGGRLDDFWSFYREYTHTAIHTAATAALAIFGILVFVDPLFAVLAIGSYVLPPVVLFLFAGDETAAPDSNADRIPDRTALPRNRSASPGRSTAGDDDTDNDADRDDGDTDADGVDLDTDVDRDSDDGDTDSDTDDGDTDSDTDDGDTDSDFDRDG